MNRYNYTFTPTFRKTPLSIIWLNRASKYGKMTYTLCFYISIQMPSFPVARLPLRLETLFRISSCEMGRFRQSELVTFIRSSNKFTSHIPRVTIVTLEQVFKIVWPLVYRDGFVWRRCNTTTLFNKFPNFFGIVSRVNKVISPFSMKVMFLLFTQVSKTPLLA